MTIALNGNVTTGLVTRTLVAKEKSKSIARLGLRTAVVSAVAAVGFSLFSPAQGAEKFRIGAVLPMSGPYSQYGDFTAQGLRVGINTINAGGGILGREVELLVRDDAGNPGRTLLAVKELVENQKVDLIYPEIISGMVLSVLPYTTQQSVLTLSSGASPQIGDAKQFPYSFQYTDLATKRIPPMVSALKKLGGKKVGILVSTNPPQVALGDALSADLKSKYGMEVVDYLKFAGDLKDLAPQLQQLRDKGADIIAFDSAARDNIRVVMTGLQTLGWKVKLVTLPASLYGDLTEQIPAGVQDQFYAVNYRIGTIVGSRSPQLDKFVEDAKKIGPIQNLAIAALSRDVVFLAKWGFETAMKESGNATAASVKAALESLHRRTYPADYSISLGNPKYTPEDHSTNNADYSEFWGLVHVSPMKDGAYSGEALPLPPQ